MSERSDIAERVAVLFRTNEMTTPYGGDVIKAGQKYTVLFSKPAILDGVVNVFGPKFIQISYQTQYRELPNRDNRVFESEADAQQFLLEAFVFRNFQAALAIPTKSK
jgi:hypothetical protein